MKTYPIFLTVLTFFTISFYLISTPVKAEEESYVLRFDRSKLKISQFSRYDVVRYSGLDFTTQVAAPMLPVKIVHLALPAGKEISGITIVSAEKVALNDRYHLLPVQSPHILSSTNVRFDEPDQRIYSSSRPFPEAVVRIASQGNFAGYNLGSVLVSPVQYVPSQGQLVFYSEIEFRITYSIQRKTAFSPRQTPYSQRLHQNILANLVENPQSLTGSFSPGSGRSSSLSEDQHLYVIITGDNLATSFQPLADWKTEKGLSAKIVKTSWIYANYPGIDNPARIRNFITDAAQQWGTLWVLLGGDVNIVPDRKAFAMDCEYGPYSHNFIPCDLYYTDLDGSWNENGNSIYGEVADSVDMYPDIFVGRASVETAAEADVFVNKLLTYEKSAPNGHEQNMLFLGEVLWTNPYTNSGLGKDLIDSLYVPAQFDPITKLYEALGNENLATVMSALNAGQNIVNHNGHAGSTGMGVGTGYLTISKVDMLTNSQRYSILYSIGCWPAAFDEDCIAEHFLTNPNGGAVAFVGNSRYGWGSPGNPLYGYSDRFDQQFFKKLFQENIYHIGNTLAAAKTAYVPFSAQENVYRWCEYEINLLGDPEMPIWTETPQALSVAHPQEITIGNGAYSVTVTRANQPVEGALVCLMQDTAVYETGFTGPDGRVILPVSISVPVQPLRLTVTAQNAIPYQAEIPLMSNQPYMRISAYRTNGSPEGFISPGETVSMDACFKNVGNQPAGNLSATMQSTSTYITLLDSTESIGTVSPGDSVWITGAFSYEVNSTVENGQVFYLESDISDDQSHLWRDKLSITAATPVISYLHHTISDSLYGDGDGFAEPGETIDLRLVIRNTGLRSAQNVQVNLSSVSPHLTISNPTLAFGEILPAGQSGGSTQIGIDPACPEPDFPIIDLDAQSLGNFQFSDSFMVSVGKFGFYDDMESGDTFWTHTGSIDLWHLSQHRKHSGNVSWYCGNEGGFVYNHNMSNILQSIPITIDQDAELSFWCWYEFPNYGTDGFYVEVFDSAAGWRTLDFIGSGGALGTLSTGNDWLEYTYDLSRLPAGTHIQVRFRFVSDDQDVAEGVYIDDVSVNRQESGIPPVSGETDQRVVTDYRLFQNYPNPFNPVTTISYQLPEPSVVRLTIYNLLGQKIRTLVQKHQPAGTYSAQWDGRDEQGRTSGSGIFFYRLQAGKYMETRKMMLMR